MDTVFLFNWALAAASLFDTIVLIWLGLTVLLNAEKRSWAIWFASSGFLLGGTFFVCHTATLDYTVEALIKGIVSWWYISWISVILLPLGWYVLILWYTGYWSRHSAELRRRQRAWLILASFLCTLLLVLLWIVSPKHFLFEMAHPHADSEFAVKGIPLLALIYPFYITQCIALSLDALLRPGPERRIMADVARQRARPWLIGSSLVQLIVSLLVDDMLWRIVIGVRRQDMGAFVNDALLNDLAAFEFIITCLVGLAIVLVGKAIVSYEIFTGKILPRHGFLRQWRGIIAVALAYSAVVSYAALRNWGAVYLILLTTVLMSLFYALLNWRSYREKEQYFARLRPFVASQHLYEHLLSQTPILAPDDYAWPSFQGLSHDLLGASVAYLVALGPLAPLVGARLSYPADNELSEELPLAELKALLGPGQPLCVPLTGDEWGGASWAVPLWSNRDLSGALLIGNKRDGGLYTQEEMEIAQASGERIIDTLASAALAQRLMTLQRQRLAESQVMDRRSRRTLHDEILPRLHTAMLALSAGAAAGNAANQEALDQLGQAHRDISDLLREMPTGVAPEVARLGLEQALRQLIDKEFRRAFDQVEWQLAPEAVAAMGSLPALSSEVLFYAAREAIRNAARYGRPEHDARPLKLRIEACCADDFALIIEDNGVGFEAKSPSRGGSGQGLSLHSTLMAVVGGALSIDTATDDYTRIRLTLPYQLQQ